jgi:hypothetical protein
VSLTSSHNLRADIGWTGEPKKSKNRRSTKGGKKKTRPNKDRKNKKDNIAKRDEAIEAREALRENPVDEEALVRFNN